MRSGGTNPPPGRSPASEAKHRAGPKKRAEPHDSRSEVNGSDILTVHTTIPSDFAASHAVQKRILEAVEKVGFTPHSSFAIKLALEEAMINAIKHGNRQDPKKSVHIQAKVTPKLAEITIEDEGPGFDRASVPDPTLEENIEKCSGRGILLIESYMNSVKWTNHGRRLQMIKRNGEEPGVR
jgi:serine/threonine-protein kinase RsbW